MAKAKSTKAIGLTEARRLVSAKYEDEKKGLTEGATADKYREALLTSPATMAVALYELAVKKAPTGTTRT